MKDLAKLLRLQHEIEGRFGAPRGLQQPVRSVSIVADAVLVDVTPSALNVAAEIHEQFGADVKVRAGFKPFPPDPEFEVMFCEVDLRGDSGDDMFVTSVQMDERTVRGGDNYQGQVELHCLDHEHVGDWNAACGPAWLREIDSRRIVGGFSGSIGAALKVVSFGSDGELSHLPFVGGTESVATGDLYLVSPGVYEVAIPVKLTSFEADRYMDHLLVARGRVRIVK